VHLAPHRVLHRVGEWLAAGAGDADEAGDVDLLARRIENVRLARRAEADDEGRRVGVFEGEIEIDDRDGKARVEGDVVADVDDVRVEGKLAGPGAADEVLARRLEASGAKELPNRRPELIGRKVALTALGDEPLCCGAKIVVRLITYDIFRTFDWADEGRAVVLDLV